MCIPLLPWVILGTPESPAQHTHTGTGQWFPRREGVMTPGSTEEADVLGPRLTEPTALGFWQDWRGTSVRRLADTLCPLHLALWAQREQSSILQSEDSFRSRFVTYYPGRTLGKLLICDMR